MSFVRILVSLFIGVMLVVSCGSETEDRHEEHQPDAPVEGEQPEMPGQMQEPADVDLDDEEIEKFVDAAIEIQNIHMGAQEGMAERIEEEGMDLQRFQEIQAAQQQGETDATDEELEQFQSIMQAIQADQAGLQEEMEDVIEDAGLTVQRYEEIANAVQFDEELLREIESKMDERMQGQMPQQAPQDPR